MSDNRRRRYRKGRDEREKKHAQVHQVVLAKRENIDVRAGTSDIKPKILLKSKTEKDNEPSSSNYMLNDGVLKTIIVDRSESGHSPALSTTTSPNITLQRDVQQNSSANVESVTQNMANMQILEPVPKMTRPTTVISSTGYVNSNAKKLLMKQNTEFLVVGVVGTQGVGKSTIMNLLATDEEDYDYYGNLFMRDDGVFRTRVKPNKCPSRASTESTHMFINSDRVIILDTPPVQTNPYKKDMTSSELDDLHLIIGLYSVCHLLIVVENDYTNLNFMRLMRFAELMKPPTQEDKHIISNYLPQLLFVKNRVKSIYFNAEQIEAYGELKFACFNDSELNIYLGKTSTPQTTASLASPNHNLSSNDTLQTKQKRMRNNESEKSIVNTFFMPNIEDGDENSQIALKEAITKLRRLVFMTPRSQMYNGAQELFTETVWFDMLTQIWQDTQYFFLNTYEDMHRQVYDVSVVNGNGGSNSGGAGNSNGTHHSSYGKEREISDWKSYANEKSK